MTGFRTAVFAAFGVFAAGAATAQNADTLRRGEYLARIMDCAGCHTPGALAGQPDQARALAGSNIGFEVPNLGYIFPPNLTPDRDTGLGRWSAAEMVAAIRTGHRPDGRILVPIMPWPSYAALTDADAEALVAYLRGLAPISNQVPAMTGAGGRPGGPYLTVAQP